MFYPLVNDFIITLYVQGWAFFKRNKFWFQNSINKPSGFESGSCWCFDNLRFLCFFLLGFLVASYSRSSKVERASIDSTRSPLLVVDPPDEERWCSPWISSSTKQNFYNHDNWSTSHIKLVSSISWHNFLTFLSSKSNLRIPQEYTCRFFEGYQFIHIKAICR